MRILMIIGQFYPTVGGAERQCLKLSKELIKRGHKISVLTTWTDRSTARFDEVDDICVERIWSPVFFIFGRRVGLGKLAPIFLLAAALRSAARHDVIHVHQALWPLCAAAVAGQVRRRPVICKIGNSGDRFDLAVLRGAHWFGRFGAWLVKRVCARFVWTSSAVRDDLLLEKIAGEQLAYIPNGVELQSYRVFADSEKEMWPVRFVFTGTFTMKKNLCRLLEAASQLPAGYRERMRLLLLGDGPDRGVLTGLISKYKIESLAEIRGPVDDVIPDLQKSDVFILPSATEGLSNSALEAMACSLPVILSDRGGNADLVPDAGEVRAMMRTGQTGILIDPDNIDSIVKAMKYLIDSSMERRMMGLAARRLIEERYALKHVAHQYEDLYRVVTRGE